MILSLVVMFCFTGGLAWALNDWIMETDNHDATFGGTWGTSTARILYYGDDYRYVACSGSTGTVTGTAQFLARTTVDQSGYYTVFARWVVDPNRTTAAPYDIYADDGDTVPIGAVTRNQEVNGGEWRVLGTYLFTAGNRPKVILKNNCAAEGDGAYVIADAIRWVKENIGSGDTVNEPGIEFSGSSSRAVNTVSTNSAALTDLASITLTAPSNGYVHVQASGIVRMDTAYRWVRVAIGRTSGGSSFDSMAPLIEVATDDQAGIYSQERRFSMSKVYSVSAGTNSYYLKALREDTTTNGNIIWDNLTATFFPTRY